jgi:hypothetical protein
MKLLGRFLYRSCLAVLWLGLFVLALETCEGVRPQVAGLFYKRFFAEQNNKVYGMVPADKLEQNKRLFHADAKTPMSAPAPTAAPPQTTVPRDVEEARDRHAASSALRKGYVAALRGQAIFQVDATGRLVESYGVPEIDQYFLPYFHPDRYYPYFIPKEPKEWIERAPTLEHPETSALTFDFRTLKHFCQVTLEPHREANAYSGFTVRIQDETLKHSTAELVPKKDPKDTNPWDLPFVRYFRNYGTPTDFFTKRNNFGFRDYDITVPKPAGIFRIVCVGGSTTEEGNTIDLSYPKRLEVKLRAIFGDRVEVWNCGICGIVSYDERLRFADYLQLQPDLILYYNGINDITHMHFGYWNVWAERHHPWLLRSWFLKRHWNQRLLPPDDDIRAFMQATTLRNFGAMGYATREYGAEMAFCSFATATPRPWSLRDNVYLDLNMEKTWSSKYFTYKTYLHLLDLHNQLLRELCADEGYYYVPVAEEFHAGLDQFFDVCHMTPLGMEVKTDIIAAYVKEIVAKKLPPKS